MSHHTTGCVEETDPFEDHFERRFYFINTFLPLLMLFIEMSDKTEPASKQNLQSFPPSTL